MSQNISLQDQRNLLKQVSNGDVAAFRILFDAYNKRLYAASLKITKSSYGAEEVVQEVFIGLWERRTNLQDIENPSAYIFTVAYNCTFRYLKKVTADKNMLESLRGRIHELNNETEEWLDMKETNELISQAVEKLPPKRQLVFKLSRENGLSHNEIAEKLNISPLTVKKQIVMALRSIRTSLSIPAAPLFLLFYFIYMHI